jgi:hypothetical protein
MEKLCINNIKIGDCVNIVGKGLGEIVGIDYKFKEIYVNFNKVFYVCKL